MSADKSPQFKASVDTQVLVKEMRKVEVDGIITYETLSGIISRDVAKNARYVVESARRILMKEDNIVFACIPTIGYKRLGDPDKVDLSKSSLSKIRNQARRGIQTLAATDYEKLSQGKKIEHNASASVLGVIAAVSKTKAVSMIAEKAAQNSRLLALNETFDLFRK
jgi:hypothetical protein